MVARRILLALLALPPGCAREVTEPAVDAAKAPVPEQRPTAAPLDGAALREQARARMVEHEFAEAAALFEKACGVGDQGACVGLADMLDRGLGVREDGDRARSLYAAACAHGMQSACDKLGH